MKIDFDGIQAFVAIAELGGFSKAAESLHVTQTALTRRIQKLESYLGLRGLGPNDALCGAHRGRPGFPAAGQDHRQ